MKTYSLEKEKVINLPPTIYESSYYNLIEILGSTEDYEEICLDFSRVRFWTPAATLIVLTKVHNWLDSGKLVSYVNIKKAPAYRYLQRINFFEYSGIETTEHFTRHDHRTKFVPINGIGRKGKVYTSDTGHLATLCAECLAPEESKYWEDVDFLEYKEEKTMLYDYLEYSISELSRNVLDHSQSNGHLCVQYTERSQNVRIAIADSGIGIKESFKNSTHWKEDEGDIYYIKKALESEVSSKTANAGFNFSNNAGVGLTCLKLLAQHVEGDLIIVSGNGFVDLKRDKYIKEDCKFNGTLCALTFKRNQLQEFQVMLESIKQSLGLKKLSPNNNINFS